MNHLIVYTHLNPQSFTHAVAEEVQSVSIKKGHDIKFIDLYADKFNPVLEFPDVEYGFMDGEAPADVKNYQDQVAWAEHITFVYPMWWGQMPAMLKGFIDRVFSNGFAYAYGENGPEGLLTGKSVQLIINTGNTTEVLSEIGITQAATVLNEAGIFGFCGMSANVQFFGNIVMSTDEERKQYLARVGDIVS